jgi:excisionase family DNA binding protein
MLSHPMLTVHDVAALLQVKESTVRTWIHEASLRAVKFGRDWRVAQKDLEAFVNARANRPPEPDATPSDR